MKKEQKIEILAPAGSYECFHAAIQAGADAVYAAGARFGARAYADNFSQDELLRAIREAHLHDRRFYLTVNTLLKDEELADLYDYLAPLYACGLDAVIVQDIGVFSFIRQHFPEMDLHASTQMTLTNSLGAQFLEQEGAARIVPSRELSLNEIRKIHQDTNLEIECFVHGALCYCYSGQCLLSSMIGGRSGNRGQCAQPCRLPYTADGKQKYYLSLKDICTLELIPDLIEAGIDSFKIEGRMKKPEYVAGVTSMYRKYVDLYLRNGRDHFSVSDQDREMLMDLYNRGNSHTGYYLRQNGRDMLALDRPNHAGVAAVRVTAQSGREISGVAMTQLHAQDVLEIAGGKNNYTFGKDVKKGETVHFLVPKKMNFPKGTVFHRIRNQQLIERLDHDYINGKLREKIYGFLSLTIGQKGFFTVCKGNRSFTAYTEVPVQAAANRPLEEERLRTQLMKTGETPFEFETLELQIDPGSFLPMKELNRLRRYALDGLEEAIADSFCRDLLSQSTLHESGQNLPDSTDMVLADSHGAASPLKSSGSVSHSQIPGLSILVETEEQWNAITGFILSGQDHGKIQRLYPDFRLCTTSSFDRDLKALQNRQIEICPAFPYIFREKAVALFKKLYPKLSLLPVNGILIRNYESYQFLKEHGFDKKIILDHNLYIFNQSSRAFWVQHGVSEMTAPLELNARELGNLGLTNMELPVYGYLPVMISAQCIQNTVRGCTHTAGLMTLSDRKGLSLQVKNFCDLCYNVIYDPSPLCLLEFYAEIQELAPLRSRLQFTSETGEQVCRILRLFCTENNYTERTSVEIPFDYMTGHFHRGII